MSEERFTYLMIALVIVLSLCGCQSQQVVCFNAVTNQTEGCVAP